jgi:hypothetical protein
VPVEGVDAADVGVEESALLAAIEVGVNEGVAAFDVGVEVGQGAFVVELELAVDCLSVLAFKDFEQEAELGDFHGLRVNVHAVDVVEEYLLLFSGGEQVFAGTDGEDFIGPFGRVVFDVPVEVIVKQAGVAADEERAGAAGFVEEGEFGNLGRGLARNQFADGVPDDVVDDVLGV